MHAPISGNFGTCYFTDGIEALKKKKDNSADVVFTDPPYNENCDLSSQLDANGKRTFTKKSKKVYYKDKYNEEEYRKSMFDWFDNACRVADKVIFTPGNQNIQMWLDHKKPQAIFIHYKPNGMSVTSMVRYARYEFILVYGHYKHNFDFLQDVLVIPEENPIDALTQLYYQKVEELRMLRDMLLEQFNKDFEFPSDVLVIPVETGKEKFVAKHSTPKPFKLYYAILKRMKRMDQIKTVIDTFLGSGTTAQACEQLGLQWEGYEIFDNPDIVSDIERRIQNGIAQYPFELSKKQKQSNLSAY